MSVTITPNGKFSVWIDKVYRDGTFLSTSAIRYPHSGVIAYDNPHALSKDDHRTVARFFAKDRRNAE
jgi:hypothetical protein